MAAPKVSDEEFIRIWTEERGVPSRVALRTDTAERNILARRNRLEKRHGLDLSSGQDRRTAPSSHGARLHIEVPDGVVIVGSDAHFWPDIITPAFRAFIKFCEEMKPKAVILNGDMLDGASISRHAPIGWETRPSLIQEIETVQDRLHEVAMAAGKKAHRIWTLGNHDARLESRLASVAPEYARVHGVHLKDHVPGWEPCWSVWINNEVVVKHRHKSGIHATHNNVMWAGKSMVTGHLHSLKVTPFSDYNPRPRFGVDCGTLADPKGPQFVHYLEDGPTNWRSGFAVLTFKDSKLLWPELVHVWDQDHVEFRGEIVRV